MYTGVTVHPGGSAGQELGEVLLSGVRCSGVEKELLDCRYSPAMPIECTHSRDVAVTCVGTQVCSKVTVGLFLVSPSDARVETFCVTE